MRSLRYVPALLLIGAWSAPASAQQNVGGGFTISGGATATTDYRFRGVSQSDRDPALQGDITIDHESGFYAGGFVSTLSDDILPGEIELSGYVGYTREIASGTDIDLGLQLFGYPANDALTDASYFEPYSAVRHTLGPVTAELGAAYAPEQGALADNDSLYVYGDLTGGVPFTPVTITARVGYTSGPARFAGLADYLDWRVGAEYKLSFATAALEYVDTDVSGFDAEDGTIVASLRLGF